MNTIALLKSSPVNDQENKWHGPRYIYNHNTKSKKVISSLEFGT